MPSSQFRDGARVDGSGRVTGFDTPLGPRSPKVHDRESRAEDGRGRVTGARVLGPRMPPVQDVEGVGTDAGVTTDTGAREGGSVGTSQLGSLQTMKPQESRTARACPQCSRPSVPTTWTDTLS